MEVLLKKNMQVLFDFCYRFAGVNIIPIKNKNQP